MQSAEESQAPRRKACRPWPYHRSALLRGPVSVTHFERRSTSFEYAWQSRPALELTAIASGSGHRIVGGGIAAFTPGDLVLIGSVFRIRR